MTLKDIYEKKLNYFKNNNIKDIPSKLLALLLLQERDYFKTIYEKNPNSFLEECKDEILNKIKQVENDFDFKDDDYKKVAKSDNYDIFTDIYYDSFLALEGAIVYNSDRSPEVIYEFYFDESVPNEIIEFDYDKVLNKTYECTDSN